MCDNGKAAAGISSPRPAGSALVTLTDLDAMLEPIRRLSVGMRLIAATDLLHGLDLEHARRLTDRCIEHERIAQNKNKSAAP